MSGIILIIVLSCVTMFVVSKILTMVCYNARIIEMLAILITAITIFVIVKTSFYDVFNLCERISVENGVFVFAFGGGLCGSLLYLINCGIGQIATGCKLL